MLPMRCNVVRSAVKPDPELISIALRAAHKVMDRVDNHQEAYISSSVVPTSDARQDARAWMWACLLLIDQFDISSTEIAAVATRVWKGAQDAFDIHS